ncbi:putative serine protease K12H4.7 [Uranotaenia lowii]|uniref:putative serine protease K12H4.7 n=1 Tax=Uranotaenia lowii TaxID=190385 RepID=UPI0024795B11|nr:putative serine protease K12H4.7 [Uranotaenia lowii]XP_055612308.1 putative serine protease K12H4.7 [Uranotaenia lowii]
MVSKLILVALLATVVVGLPAKQNKVDVLKSPLVNKMMQVFGKPQVPEGYKSINPRTTQHFFRTRVDHFNPQNRDTFEMYYLSNDEFYRPGGPIFIIVGGAWMLEPYFIEHSFLREIAAYENGWLFTNEHRYFGDSVPTEDLSSENLQYLTTEQALVDMAEWIHHLRTNVLRNPSAKVVLFGIGHAGALATWMRQRYPHLVRGAWASSGQLEARLNFKEYAVEVGQLVRDFGNDDCYSQLWRGFRTAENLMDAGFTEVVTNMFRTCEPVDGDDALEVESFFWNLKESIQTIMLVEQNSQYTGFNSTCAWLERNDASTDLQDLADWMEYFYSFYECMPFDFEASTEFARDIDRDDITNYYLGIRQRSYQLCTEFGWFLTADADEQPFGQTVSPYYFHNFCRAVFGDWMTTEVVNDGVFLTNLHFGAQNPSVTNVVFTNGALDPVRDVSITEYYATNSGAIVIDGEFGGSDVLPVTGFDSTEVLEAKNRVHQFIRSWIQEGIIPIEG